MTKPLKCVSKAAYESGGRRISESWRGAKGVFTDIRFSDAGRDHGNSNVSNLNLDGSPYFQDRKKIAYGALKLENL